MDHIDADTPDTKRLRREVASELHSLLTNRALSQIHAAQFSAALSDAEESISILPSHPKGFLRKGQVLQRVDNFGDAQS